MRSSRTISSWPSSAVLALATLCSQLKDTPSTGMPSQETPSTLQPPRQPPAAAVEQRPGCGTSWRGPWNLSSDGLMQAADRGGNSQLGSILFIGQMHWNPGRSPQKELKIFEYQMNIYRLLEKIRPEVIFLENEAFNIHSTQLRLDGFPAGYLDDFIPEQRFSHEAGLKLFRNGLPDPMTWEEKRLVAILGAAKVYVFSRDGLQIRRSNTLAEELEVTDEALELASLGKSFSAEGDRLQRKRERFLAREVTDYMKNPAPPCATVIIYGDEHLRRRRIEEAFDTYGFRPHIQAVIFPGALDYRK